MLPIDPDFGQHSQGTIMDSVLILACVVSFLIGLGLGWWSYRYTLKRNPEKLERIAREAKELGDKARDRL